MNKFKQLLALVKFQVAINPFIIMMPLAFGMFYYIPIVFTSFSKHEYHPGLEFLLSNQNMFLVAFVGVFLLAPEMMRSECSNIVWSTGTEFLLTRAVDRRLVLRARSLFYYFLVLALPLAAYLFTLRHPDLQVTEDSKVAYQQVLDHMPGSIPAPDAKTITIRHGNSLVEFWRLWLFVCTAIGTQVFVYVVYPLKYRMFLLWGAYVVFIFAPLLLFGDHFQTIGRLSNLEIVFYAFVAYQPIFWLVTSGLLLMGQLWCERRFCRVEQS